MSVRLECLNYIVPIKTIRKKYPGGWEQCLLDHAGMIGDCVWYDEHLFREGAMSPMGVMLVDEKWKKLGFRTYAGGKNPSKWIDACVVDTLSGGPTLPCDWIEVEDDTAFLKGTPKGNVVGCSTYTG